MVALRVAAHYFDKQRIKDEVETRLGRAVSIVWNPFGRGWFFEKGERHYDVTYVDRHSGGTVTTACKTSMFTGVYWADGERNCKHRRASRRRTAVPSAATRFGSNGVPAQTAARRRSSHKTCR